MYVYSIRYFYHVYIIKKPHTQQLSTGGGHNSELCTIVVALNLVNGNNKTASRTAINLSYLPFVYMDLTSYLVQKKKETHAKVIIESKRSRMGRGVTQSGVPQEMEKW